MTFITVFICFLFASIFSLPANAHWTIRPTLTQQLEGVYIADYHCGDQCKDEIINVYHTFVNETDVLVGIKVKGDEWVPAGEVSFIADAVTRRAFIVGARSTFIDPVYEYLSIEFLNDTCFMIEASGGSMNKILHYHKLRNFDFTKDRQMNDMLLVASTHSKNARRGDAKIERAEKPLKCATTNTSCAECPEVIEIKRQRQEWDDYHYSLKHDSALEFEKKYPGGTGKLVLGMVIVSWIAFSTIITIQHICCRVVD